MSWGKQSERGQKTYPDSSHKNQTGSARAANAHTAVRPGIELEWEKLISWAGGAKRRFLDITHTKDTISTSWIDCFVFVYFLFLFLFLSTLSLLPKCQAIAGACWLACMNMNKYPGQLLMGFCQTLITSARGWCGRARHHWVYGYPSLLHEKFLSRSDMYVCV